MRKYWTVLVLMPVLAAAGCGGGGPDEPGAQGKHRPSKHADVPLADLLGKPRQELAGMGDDLAADIRTQEKARRDGHLDFRLLPELHLPLALPVLREAKYSAKAGFSLPPYAADGEKDNDLALHLARYGDAEA